MNEAPQKITLSGNEYASLCRQALSAYGVEDDLITMVIDSLYWCDTHGISSHGMNMLPTYLDRLSHGGINPHGRPCMERHSNALVRMDGDAGFGQVAGRMAADHAIEAARQHGLGLVSVRNTNHGGALGCFTDYIASRGYIGFMAHNSNPTVAPFGGSSAAIGTNPLSFAFPGKDFNILVDLATSATAKGKIYELARHSDTIPAGLALNKDGEPTTSAAEAIKGILLPLGGPKGYALAVAVELLTGILSGGSYNYEISSFHHEPGQPQGISMLIMAVHVSDLIDKHEYQERLEHFSGKIKETRKASGVSEILMPGEREARLAAIRRAEGVPLPLALVDEVKKLASEHRV
jgi:LDH2 family malate/lactate/ureidoglycolate dehydrogenase